MEQKVWVSGLVVLSFVILIITGNISLNSDSAVVVDPYLNNLFSNNLISGAAVGLNEDETVSVIITLKDDEYTLSNNLEERKEAIKDLQEEVLDHLDVNIEEQVTINENNPPEDIEVGHLYSTINALAGDITEEGLEKLKDDPNVERVDFNYPIMLSLDTSTSLINADDVWDVSVNGVAIDGTGETICVIDTGADYTHPALGGCTTEEFLAGDCNKVIAGYDFGNDDNDPKDVHGHGSHVSGIATSEDLTYRGVAPGAKIVAMKVFSDAGYGNTADAISAIDWCVNNATIFNISIITMSIGVTNNQGAEIPYLSTCDDNDLLAAKSSWAVSQGIFVDASAGNSKSSAGITAPACGESVTSVGAVNDGDDIVNYNTAPILSVLAPGFSITSTITNSNFGSKSGTSMAAPYVAGAAALVMEYWKSAYGVTPTPLQVKDRLRRSGELILDTRNNIYFPRINVLKAIQPFINYTVDNPINAITISTSTATINITSDVNLNSAIVEWESNNGSINNYSMTELSDTNFQFTMNALESGNYTYRVYGNDIINTTGVSADRTLIVDLPIPVITLPSIIFISPRNNSFLKNNFNLNITLVNSIISSTNYTIKNSAGTVLVSNFNNNISSGIFSWTDIINISSDLIPDDTYTLIVSANGSSNIFNTSEIVFVVDRTFPSLYVINISQSIYNDDSITFRINVTDKYLNDSTIYFESDYSGNLTNYTMQLENNSLYNYVLTGPNNLINQQNVSYRFYANDLAGNINASNLFSFVVQNRIPVVNILSPDNETTIEFGDSLAVTSAATDLDGDSLTYSWDFGDSGLGLGDNLSHDYDSIETFIITLNVSDPFSSITKSRTVIVSDTAAPIITTNYDSEIHLERDGTMSLGAITTDHSGIFNLTGSFEGLTLPSGTSYCTDLNTTAKSCTWTITFEDEDVGSHGFTIDATDDSLTKQTTSSSYSVSFTSCSDSSQNGDETGTDCGGSCTIVCSPAASSSSSSSSGGGGGGGGGGSSSKTASPTAITSAAVTEETVTKEPILEEVAETTETQELSETLETNTIIESNDPELEASWFNGLTGAFGVETISNLNSQWLVLLTLIACIVILSVIYLFVWDRSKY